MPWRNRYASESPERGKSIEGALVKKGVTRGCRDVIAACSQTAGRVTLSLVSGKKEALLGFAGGFGLASHALVQPPGRFCPISLRL
jgi:hypothetical protein